MTDWIHEKLLLGIAGLPEDEATLYEYAQSKKWQSVDANNGTSYHFDSLPKKVQVYLAKNDLIDDNTETDDEILESEPKISPELDWEQTIQDTQPTLDEFAESNDEQVVTQVQPEKISPTQPKEKTTMSAAVQNPSNQSNKIDVLLDVIQLSNQEWSQLHQHQMEHIIANGQSDELIALQNQMMANLQKIMQAIQSKLG